ncbi:MAG TPA: WXG100 family type VII secretion target [Anaerolineales bacterium]|nr:WXG100 family type VII secretion target [Anaerolineales bacterium]
MSIGNAFQFDFGKVAEAIGKFSQQKDMTEQNQALIKAAGPKVQGAWIGGDADEFVADIARKLTPKFAEFAAALAGVILNLNKSSSSVSDNDKKASSLADGLANTFSQIF